MSLLPPPENIQYASRQALLDGLQSHARSNGYAVAIRRYNAKDRATHPKCDRGGVYKVHNGLTDTNRLRDTGTRLLDCPWSIRANYKDDFWVITIRNGQHNHEGTTSSYSHPIQRRMPAEVAMQVEALSNSGSKP
jgi:malonate-semialdehyde dehydrogenase (acetylating) / methylmalonate-semialdehyde dehydrogenase